MEDTEVCAHIHLIDSEDTISKSEEKTNLICTFSIAIAILAHQTVSTLEIETHAGRKNICQPNKPCSTCHASDVANQKILWKILFVDCR